MEKKLSRASKLKHGISTGGKPTRSLLCKSEKYHCTIIALRILPWESVDGCSQARDIGLDGPLAWTSADTPAV